MIVFLRGTRHAYIERSCAHQMLACLDLHCSTLLLLLFFSRSTRTCRLQAFLLPGIRRPAVKLASGEEEQIHVALLAELLDYRATTENKGKHAHRKQLTFG